MNWLLFFSLLFLLIIIFIVLDRDVLSPSFIATLAFFLSTICFLYEAKTWDVSLSITTYLLIIGTVLTFFISELMVRLIRYKGCIKPIRYNTKQFSNIRSSRYLCLFVCVAEVLILIIIKKYVGSNYSGSNYTDVMNEFRKSSVTLPFWLRQMTKLMGYLSMYYILVFSIKFSYAKGFINKIGALIFIFPVLFHVISNLLLASRASMLTTFISLAVTLLFTNTFRKTKNMRISFRTFVIGIISLVLVFLLFSVSRALVGRLSTQSFLDYICYYTGGSIALLDIEVNNLSLYMNEFKGASTFGGLLGDLNQLGLMNKVSGINLFGVSNGILIGNVYTTIGTYIQDFGYAGNFILCFLEGLFFSILYEIIKTQKKFFSVKTLIYIDFIPSLFYVSIAGEFTHSYLVINSLIFAVAMYILIYLNENFRIVDHDYSTYVLNTRRI